MAKKKVAETMIHVPIDIIECHVFPKLGTDTLMRLSLVCKRWRRLTCMHHGFRFQLRARCTQLLLQSRCTRRSLYFLDHARRSPTAVEIRTNNLMTMITNEQYLVVGSQKGLFCMASPHMHVNPVIIFNPITREWAPLPPPTAASPPPQQHVGFGYDKKSNEFKVVRLYRCCESGRTLGEVLTVGTAAWRALDVPLPVLFSGGLSSSPFAEGEWHGHFYWVIDDACIGGGGAAEKPPAAAAGILWWSVGEERFGTVSAPRPWNISGGGRPAMGMMVASRWSRHAFLVVSDYKQEERRLRMNIYWGPMTRHAWSELEFTLPPPGITQGDDGDDDDNHTADHNSSISVTVRSFIPRREGLLLEVKFNSRTQFYMLERNSVERRLELNRVTIQHAPLDFDSFPFCPTLVSPMALANPI